MKFAPRVSIGLWLGFLLACAIITWRTEYSTDLAAFLPQSPTPAQQLLVDELREGVASRLLLIGIEGTDEERLAALSGALAQRLGADEDFSHVNNGAQDRLEADLDFLRRHRYVLSPAVSAARFEPAQLRTALERQLELLNSPAGMLTARWIASDPTGEILRLLEGLREVGGPQKRAGVWFSGDGGRALLVLQTRAAGFDIDAQEQAQAKVRAAFEGVARQQSVAGAQLLMTGPGVFAVQSRDSIKKDAARFSALATILVSVILMFVYRSSRILLLTLLPVVSGALGGIAAVSLGFGAVHGVTLGFGATLIGEAVDYATYLFTNSGPEDSPRQTLARIWPTLRLGMLTSVFGFAALLFSGFPGLAQLGLFSIAGLIVAAAVTRWVLPDLAPAGYSVGATQWLGPMLTRWARNAHRLRVLLIVVLAASAVWVLARGGQPWNDDLAALSPVPLAEQRLDEQMRRDLGAPDIGPLVVIRGESEQAVLEMAERVDKVLAALQVSGGLARFDSPTALLPSAATQRARQHAIPDAQTLRRNIERAIRGLPFRSGAFSPFVEEAQAAKTAPPLTRANLQGTALALKLDALLAERHGEWFAMMPVRGLIDAPALQRELKTIGGTRAVLLDLKHETDALYRGYRSRASTFAVVGVAAIVLLLMFALRSPARVWDVLAPLAAAVLVTLAILLATAAKLNLFHLVALLLVVGVGSNYSLFFERGNAQTADPGRIYTSVFLCNLSTVIGFGVLGLASTPVLSAIGSTVAIGAFFSLAFAAILTARPSRWNSR